MILPTHISSLDFDVIDGCLAVGGRTVEALAEEIGSTPFYVYDSARIVEGIRSLKASLPDAIELHYAIKANPMPAVVNLISEHVDGLDVASGRELVVATATGTEPAMISFAGPGKTEAELAAAVAAGITINVESPTELGRLCDIAAASGQTPNVAIRVNPDFELKSSGMKMSGGPKQFGIDAEQVPAILREMAGMPVRFIGFHIFSGSQNLRADSIAESQQKSYALALSLAENAPNVPLTLNLGGGFGIPYFPGEEALELDSIGANLDDIVTRAQKDLPGTSIIIELGRYLVGESGVYICKVLDKKISRGHTFLVTDGGLHHHLAATGNFGQVIRKNYPVIIANKATAPAEETASVVGPLCTPLDLLGDKMKLADADVGDLVAVFQSGAYGYSASPHGFLSHPEPKEILV